MGWISSKGVITRVMAIAAALCVLAIALAIAVVAPKLAYAANSDSTITMYRLYNSHSGEHLYTKDTNERNELSRLGWEYEGIGWVAPAESSSPVYRLYNPNSGDHHYTLDCNEYDTLATIGWNQEGIGWYSDDAQTVPLYRVFNPYAQVGTHHYTTDGNEYDTLPAHGWVQEGVAWYAVSKLPASDNSNPFALHGALSTSGPQIVDASGDIFQLRGVSTHGLAWYPQFVNEAAFATWKDWGANAVRLANYTVEYGGWCSGGDRDALLATIDKGVKAATNQGMYVIIDWHVLNDQNPLVHVAEAKDFFQTVSTRYAGYDNVIYEICNEPNGGTNWNDVYSYATEVIPAIRTNAPNSLIVCGTPTWSQDVDRAAERPLPYANVAYALHFYAATHKESLRAKASTAISAGLPLLVSEFGISDASGNGALDEASGNQWIGYLDRRGIGYFCWSLSNKGESSALISSATNATSYWSDAELSQEGRWYKGILQERANS